MQSLPQAQRLSSHYQTALFVMLQVEPWSRPTATPWPNGLFFAFKPCPATTLLKRQSITGTWVGGWVGGLIDPTDQRMTLPPDLTRGRRYHECRMGECLPCTRAARYFYDDFPKLSPWVYHYRMKPPSRPTATSCLPNEANHPCTTLNTLPQNAISSGQMGSQSGTGSRYIWSRPCCRCTACRSWMLLPSRWPHFITFQLYMTVADP